MQDSRMLSDEQSRFLARRRVGHLATADARGAPHVVPVCFVVSEGVLYITIDQKPKGAARALKRLRNITENPAAAVADHNDRVADLYFSRPSLAIFAVGIEHSLEKSD